MGNRDREIESFRMEHESDEHWELRREFLDAHFDNFTTSKLQCLSNTYTNIEVLGCRYPAETMKTIAELAAGLGQAHKRRKEANAQRFMVDASNAAEQKIKRRTQGFQNQGQGGGYQQRGGGGGGGNYRGRGSRGGNNYNQPRVTYGPNVFGGPSVNYGPPVTGQGGYRTQ